MAEPIWKDTLLTASTAIEYSLESDGKVLAEGMLSPYPDGVVRCYVNRLCESYMGAPEISFEDGAYNDAGKTFSLVSGGTVIGSWTFFNNWDYDENSMVAGTVSEPINGHMDRRMKLLHSVYKNVAGMVCYD